MARNGILIVDDDRGIRESLDQLLREEGHQVVTARNGVEALNTLRQGHTPCLVLLDLMMPVMDGYTFMEHRKNDPALRAIPVVIITAAGVVDGDRTGDAEVLTKPIRFQSLMAAVSRHC